MNSRDPHQALKTETLAKAPSRRAAFVLEKLQWGKSDIGFSLHAQPTTHSTSGLQITDFLSQIGFVRSNCLFVERPECYVRWVDESFNLDKFIIGLDKAFENLLESEKLLEKCGIFLEQPEGWGYFYGKTSGGRETNDFQMSGDGHTAGTIKQMKTGSDETFHFAFTWIEGGQDKGWVIHYRPKHPPLSAEMHSVFRFLSLKKFDQCPEYDFDQCYFRSIRHVARGEDIFGGNANTAHGWFDAHAENFAKGLEKLLFANTEIEKTGLTFLPFDKPATRLEEDIQKRVQKPAKSGQKSNTPKFEFDVAISFAGAERKYAEELAKIVREAGFSVFYDDFYPEQLWGKDLVVTLDEIYRKRSRYCVMMISKDYSDRVWTVHERRSAQARALKEKGKEYILPIKIDDTELDGMLPTIAHVSITMGVDKIADLLLKKLLNG
jgi:hypothetical protein